MVEVLLIDCNMIRNARLCSDCSAFAMSDGRVLAKLLFVKTLLVKWLLNRYIKTSPTGIWYVLILLCFIVAQPRLMSPN